MKGFRNEAKNDRDHQLWEVRWGRQSWGESTKCSWFQSVFPSWADHLELSVSVNNPWVYLLQKAHPAVDRAPPESSACPPTADSLDRCRSRWKHAGGCSLWSGGPAIICYTWWNYGAEQLNIWSVGGAETSWSTLYPQRFTGDVLRCVQSRQGEKQKPAGSLLKGWGGEITCSWRHWRWRSGGLQEEPSKVIYSIYII